MRLNRILTGCRWLFRSWSAAVVAAVLILALPLAALAANGDTEVNLLETFEDQQKFFSDNWPQMKAALESDGPQAAVDFINNTFSDDMERRVMYAFARMGVVMSEWEGRTLDAYIPIAEAGIAECLRQAEATEDEETKRKRTNAANVISYNLGADLAFCWEDEFEHTDVHFRRGLQAGEDCLRWRTELGNPPHTFSMAYWLIGIHKLALDDKAGALSAFEDSLRYAEISAKEGGNPTGLEEGDGSIVLGHGWVTLTKVLMGDDSARADYDKVMAIFRSWETGGDEEKREDAKWYMMQLEKIEKTLGGE